jgi:D-alanine-D-alanine ligase
MLELMGIPYTGSGVLASALAMDKLKSKELFRLYNVPTPPYYTIDSDRRSEIEEVHGSFGFPAFVKPRRAGSSVAKASDMAELRARMTRRGTIAGAQRFVGGRDQSACSTDAAGRDRIVPKAFTTIGTTGDSTFLRARDRHGVQHRERRGASA